MKRLKLLILGCACAIAACLNAPAQTTNVAKPAQPAPAPTPAAAATNRNIRFQFDGIPYADVLERFAQTANKPLVADTNIQGTLTYNDQQPYSYQEALDTLNVMLSMKGAMLVEDGHYLRLVPVKQLPQVGLKILRGLDQTGDVRPGEVVTVVLDVNNLDAKDVGEAVVSMLSNAGSIAPLSRGRGLIITDRLANIQRIKTLLSAIDTETVSNRQMKAFTLLHSSGAVVADLINRTFGVATAPKRTQYNPNSKALEVLPADPNDYITAVFDDASRTLVLFGPRDRIGLAEELISKFEDKEGGSEVRIYQPQVTKAEELAQMIRQAIPGVAAPGETAASAATKARVIADNALNRLIVAAPVAGQLDQIEQLINRLDKPVHGTGGSQAGTRAQNVQITKVFRPRSSDAVSVAKILTEALSKRLPSGQTVTTANVTVEPNSHSVVVTGSPSEVQTAVDIITQLETGSSMPTPQQTKFIDVGGIAEAKRLLPLIEQIYRSQVTDSLGGQVAHAKMIADVDSGRLIVTASDDHLKRIDGIVTQLRTQNIKAQTRRVHTITPKHARVDAVFSSISSLVTERMTDKRFEDTPKPVVLADNPNNRILVTGTEDQIKEIEQVVNLFDLAPEKTRREMTVIAVQSKSAEELIALTTTLIAQIGEQQSNPQLAPKLIPDGKQIIVLATAKDLERITNLVQQLDTASTAVTSRQFKGIELASRKATELTKLVQQLYSEQLKGQPDPAGGAATLIEDNQNNRIMVSGSDREIQRVEAIIRQLDPQGQKPVREETRVIRLKNALAADLAALVEKSVNVQAQKLRVLVDQRSNSLVLNGDTTAVDAAAQVIAQLDTRAETQPREMRIIELKQGDANTVGPMVTTVFTEIIKDQRGAEYVPQTKIVSDTAANRLIVTGPKEELETVANVVQQLDQLPETAGGARVFKLLMADAATVAPVVSNAMVRFDVRNNQPIRRVTVSADRESNSIIVAGSRADLQDAEKIIERLDHEGEKGRSLKVVEINTDDADALAALAMKVFTAQNTGRNIPSVVSITPEPSGKRLIVLAPENIIPQIENVITMLDTKPEQGSRELHVVEIKNGAAQEILPTVNRIYAEQTQGKSTKPATMYPDSAGARLMVYGTKDQATAIRQIVATVEGQARIPREMRSFEIGAAAEVQRLLPIVQQLYQEQWKGKSDSADAQFVADAPAGRLIVSGKAEHLTAIEGILKQLNSGKPRSDVRDTRVFDLATANAAELASTVRTLYTEQSKNRLGFNASDTLILPDVAANRLVVSGVTNELDALEDIIKKLDKANVQSASTRVFKLKSGSADQVASVLSSSLAKLDPYGRPVPRVTVGADPRSNMVIVSGDPKDLQAAASIVEQFDGVASEARQMRFIPVKTGTASDLATKLRQLYLDHMKGKNQSATADALVMGDDLGNRLILAASESHMKIIEDVAKQLQDAGEGSGRQIQVVSLKHVTASPVATMISQLFSSQVGSTDPGQKLVITASPDDRTLLVDANASTLNRIQQLIQTLDRSETNGQAIIQTVHLKKTTADSLAEAVTQAIAARTAQPRLKQVSVTPVNGANALLLNGPGEAVQEVMKIVQELDQESTGGEIEVRIYKLKSADAKDVVPVLNQLLQTVAVRNPLARGEGRRFVSANIAIDDRSNSLLVSAAPAHFKLLEQLLPTLDQAPERSDRDVHFVWLKNAKAWDVVGKLTAVFEGRPAGDRPVIEADTFSNSLTVIGKHSDIAQIQDLVARLDASTKDTSLQVRLRPLDRVPAEQMARMLKNIYPQMSAGVIRIADKLPPTSTNAPATNVTAEVVIAVDKDSNVLLLSGPTQDLDQIDRIISELSYSGISGDAELHIFQLKVADPIVVARTLNQLFRTEQAARQDGQQPQQPQPQQPQPPGAQREPKMTVVAEPRTRSIIVRAKPTEFTLLESLIKQLDGPGMSPELNYRLVRLTNAPPDKLVPLVQQMVSQLRVLRPGDPLTVTGDPRSQSLLVVAQEGALNQLENIIHSLDTPAPYSEAEVLVVALKKTAAAQLATVLQNMLKPGTAGEATAEARELQEQVRRLKIQDDQGKSILLDLSKPIKVMADPVSSGVGGNRLILSSTAENLKALAAVVEMMDAVPLTEGVNVRIVRLQHADASAVMQTLNSVFQQGSRLAVGPAGIAQPEGDSGKALVYPLNVALDSRANAIILSGRKESLDLAGKLIDELDKKIERFVTEVKLFRMKHASAIRLAPLLQSVFAEGPAVPGTEGLNTQITRLMAAIEPSKPQVTETPKTRSALVVQADDTSNILIVAARTDTLPLIEAVVNQLDIPSASGLDSVRIYPLKHADAATFQKVVNDIFSGPRGSQMRLEDKPNITIDERTQALIVAGNSKSLAIIDNLLVQLDKPLALDLRDVRILPLQHADASDLAANLQRLLDARVTQKGSLNKQQSDSMRVMVLGEPRSNSILIAGSKDSFELVESLAKELDKAPTALSGKIRLVPLVYADARQVTSALLSLFSQRYQAAKSPEVQRNKPVIVPDPRNNGLLIAAGVDDNAVIDELLQKLDRKLDDPALTLTFLPLKHNDSTRIATTLESIFAARLKARTAPGQEPSPQDQVKIETDALNNALIVSANKDNLDVLKGLLEKIDIQPEVAGGMLQTFPLQFADAQRVAGMLQTLVQQGLYRPGMPVGTTGGGAKRDALAVAVDRRSNTLIVSASPENLLVIREIIKQVDTKDYAEKTNIRLYSLKHARASSLATVLEQFFRAKQAGDSVGVNATERQVPIAVIPDDRANTLLVTGSKESFDILDRVVAQLDGEDAMARMNFRVFPLKQTTAGKLQETLQKLFVNRPPRTKGEPAEPITVVADPWVNALLVGASVDDMSMVTSLIERLDSTQAQLGLTVQVFTLGKADARRVAQTVQGLYREGTPGASSAYPVLVTADERLNAIVVSAGEADLKRIGELVKKLDTDNVARVSEIRVFGLKYARAESLATILNTSLNTKPAQLSDMSPNSASVLQFIARSDKGNELVTSALKEGVLITPDARMNSLIVSAPVDYMDLLDQIITRLDSGLPQQAKVKVFTLVNADARQMAELLLGLFRLQPQQGGGQNAPQRSIEYTLVKANGNGSHGNVVKARTISTHGNGDLSFGEDFIGPLPEEEAVASATIGTAEQSALNVTVDPRTNSLLVGGTEDYVALVSEVINSLDASPGQERRSEVYRLKNAMAKEVQAAIRSFLDQEKQRVTQVLGQDAVGTAQRLLEQEIAIVAEDTSNALLLSANPRYFTQIKQLIEELDQPQPQVLIQVLLAEVSLDATRDLGIEWNLGGRIGAADIFTGADLGLTKLITPIPPTPGLPAPSRMTPGSGLAAAVTGDDFSFLLRALENEGRLEVLSRPQILTADNRPAAINIGQRVPFLTDTRITEQNTTIGTVRYESVGVNLSVTPRIGPDGSVKMDIGTTNSALSSSSIQITPDFSAPIVNERRATTTVSVQSGQSILIGGLISTVDDKRIRKIPFLGDIPYLGQLFRSTRKNMERRELLILLTPQVLVNVRATPKTMDLDEMTDKHLRESTLQDQFQKDEVKDRLLQPLIRNGTNAPTSELPKIPKDQSRPFKKDDEI
jgi:type II secretion system protein D